MKIQLDWPNDGPYPSPMFRAFLQHQINRYVQGHFRYGSPKKSKKYLKRLKMEVRAYTETGNVENLANAAVYCGLELEEPQNKKQHFDAYAPSVTRGKV